MRDVGGQQALSVPARREGDGGRPTVYGRLPTGWSAGDGLRWAERSQRPEPLPSSSLSPSEATYRLPPGMRDWVRSAVGMVARWREGGG
jgi:hypothetical protein